MLQKLKSTQEPKPQEYSLVHSIWMLAVKELYNSKNTNAFKKMCKPRTHHVSIQDKAVDTQQRKHEASSDIRSNDHKKNNHPESTEILLSGYARIFEMFILQTGFTWMSVSVSWSGIQLWELK